MIYPKKLALYGTVPPSYYPEIPIERGLAPLDPLVLTDTVDGRNPAPPLDG